MSSEPNRRKVKRATATLPEFAARYGVGRSTVYELARRDLLPIPVIRLGRRMVVSREVMERFLAREKHDGTAGTSPGHAAYRDAA